MHYSKMLEKQQIQKINIWLRLARKSASMSGYLQGGRGVAQGIGVYINDSAVVKATEKAYTSEVMASRSANKVNRKLHRLKSR